MNAPTVAVIGAGAMGALHARSIAASGSAVLGQVIDVDAGRADRVARDHGGLAATPTDRISADAVVIAAPTDRHVDLAADLLAAGVPVLVEKPLAPDVDGVRSILAAARSGGAPVMCGFVERFNPAVMTLLDLIEEPFRHFLAVRHSPPAGRPTSHVASDLLIHDIDLALRIHAAPELDVRVGSTPPPAVAGGFAGTADQPLGGEVADCTVVMGTGAVATFSASRIGQRKVREIRVMTGTALYELDLLRHDITIYRHVDHGPGQRDASYRSETVIEVPFVRAHHEPLVAQLDHFVDLITGAADPEIERAGIWLPHQLMDDLCARPAAAASLSAAPTPTDPPSTMSPVPDLMVLPS